MKFVGYFVLYIKRKIGENGKFVLFWEKKKVEYFNMFFGGGKKMKEVSLRWEIIS